MLTESKDHTMVLGPIHVILSVTIKKFQSQLREHTMAVREPHEFGRIFNHVEVILSQHQLRVESNDSSQYVIPTQ